MARKSRKNMPVAVAEPTDNLTAKAVLSMDKEAKPYQVGIYARLSFESEANKERDTVDTQIAYIREFINGQDDMVEVCVYADISVTGTTFERPEFDRMIQDIRAGKINTVITRDLSRLGRNYVEAGNYIERVFPFLDVRYIAITDDFDTARPGTDLSVPLKNIVNEYYSKDLSKKVETGKHSIWAQGGFSEGTPPYGYYRATDGSRKLLIDEEVSDNVVRIFNMFLDGKGYAGIAKTLQNEGILSPPKYRFYKSGKIELAEKAREWHYSHVKEILQGEYYIGNIVHGKQRKALDTGRKNVKTDASTWQRIENVHEPIIDKDTFYKTRERMEHIKKKHLEASKPKADVPNKPDNILVYKTKCACCGGSVLIGRHHTYSEKFYYKCKNRRKLARLCENKYSYDYSEVMDSVFSVIRQHMSLCVEKTKFVQKMNSRKENVLQYDIYTKQIAKLQNDVRRITANKSGLYSDNPDEWITAEKLEELLPDISYAVAPSRNHMVAKNGKAARPKYHVYSEIEEITDSSAHAALKAAIHNAYPFFDGNALDAARFIFGADSGEVVWQEGWTTIDEDIVVEISNEETPSASGPILEGSRNNTMSRFASRVLKKYGVTDKAREAFEIHA